MVFVKTKPLNSKLYISSSQIEHLVPFTFFKFLSRAMYYI